jgi:hypothetical protein
MIPRIPEQRLRAVRTAILKAPRYPRTDWGWIGDEGIKRLTKKRANKFLFACVLDYQMNADRLWQRCWEFLEIELGDPDSLWDSIAETRLPMWLKRTREFQAKGDTPGLHRFKDMAHTRVWRIAKRIRTEFAGDARLIWRTKTAAEAAERLVELGVGPQISHMVAGALADTGWIKGPSDVKADVHVCRTLGRILLGSRLDPDDAVVMAREVYGRNPWRIDGPCLKSEGTTASTLGQIAPSVPLGEAAYTL